MKSAATAVISSATQNAFQTPVWGFTLSNIDGITSYIKAIYLTLEPSNRRGIQVSPRLPHYHYFSVYKFSLIYSCTTP